MGEYQAFRACTSDLVIGISAADDLNGLADALLSKSLLPPCVWEEFFDGSNMTPANKTRKIVAAVAKKIKFRPTKYFQEFLDALKSFNLSYLSEELEKKFGIGKVK